jgi:hypothetical protein
VSAPEVMGSAPPATKIPTSGSPSSDPWPDVHPSQFVLGEPSHYSESYDFTTVALTDMKSPPLLMAESPDWLGPG